MTIHDTLKQYFGYENFRDGQEALIEGILAGQDVLGIMPTGAGKSMCFQIPALMMDGIVLVVSPLISLMKDQVNALNQSGIGAAYINSSLTDVQIRKALANAANEAYRLIYIAPERLSSYDFMAFAASSPISMITVDEAHCISQWGQDFRPSYAAIPDFISRLAVRPVVSAFTATATEVVRTDIVNLLKLNNPTVLVAGFDRPNLYFDVKKPKNKFNALLEFLRSKGEAAGIVYCSTRKDVEQVCDKLNKAGHTASRYHAGLTDSERHASQDDFLHDKVRVMVATNAFGMGIDKSNVSFVVHYNMPKDMEGYYQEAGRAGRDGEPADCLLLYGGRDVSTNMWLIENGTGAEFLDAETEAALKKRNIQRLQEMTMYCETKECLRHYILSYFGENPEAACGNCINCGEDYETIDITQEAQKMLSCVVRMRERFGANMVIDTLRGAQNARLKNFELHKLTTFGISKKTAAELQEILAFLIMQGYLHKTASGMPIIKLGARAAEVLSKNPPPILMKTAKPAEKPGIAARQQTGPVDRGLLDALKQLRKQIAEEQKLPAFVIFHDSTLIDMSKRRPRDFEELLSVSGVGEVKAARYGRQFLEIINKTAPPAISASQSQSQGPVDIEISHEPVSVSTLAEKINCVLLENDMELTSGLAINNWLVAGGFLVPEKIKDVKLKLPTEKGIKLGITTEEREVRGRVVQMNVFDSNAQKMIADKFLEGLKRRTSTEELKPFNSKDIVIVRKKYICVNELVKNINEELLKSGRQAISAQQINDWLVKNEFLYRLRIHGKNAVLPTQTGIRKGIYAEDIFIRGDITRVALYSSFGQELVVNNLSKIMELP